jgi:hypothetical protein
MLRLPPNKLQPISVQTNVAPIPSTAHVTDNRPDLNQDGVKEKKASICLPRKHTKELL